MKDNNKERQLGNDKWRDMVRALHETLDMLGEPSKAALLEALERDYGIVLSEGRCSPPEQIEAALTSVFGPGAEIIIKEWKKKQG
jgi:hypothetical protein